MKCPEKSPFIIHKALLGIGGEPKSIKNYDQSVLQPPSDANTVQDAKKLAKARSRKRKKELLKKMKETIIDIKMNPHRPKKPASDESTTDEEEMIVYDVEDEIESNPDYVKQNAKIALAPITPKFTHSLTGKTGTWSGFELSRTFGLVRWGLGGSGHVEGCTGES
ncbi:hypothetical protein TNCV_3731691 [Trichonephila clavipes]|nr:hypothetical protein TNCV_3731691 [Trichonephila clavipes]